MTSGPVESQMWGRAAAVFFLCVFIFIWPWLIGDLTIPGLSKNQFYPHLLFMAQSWFAGDGASWNPYIYTGHPQIADPNSLIFSPYTILASLDANPGTRAFDALTFLFLSAGGIGMIFFGRINHWHWVTSVVAALVFVFGGAAAWRLDETGLLLAYSFLPLALLYLELTLRRKNIFYALAAGVFIAVVLLTRNSLALLSFYLFAARILWFLLTPPWRAESLRRSIFPICAACFVAAALCILPILYTLDLYAMAPALEMGLQTQAALHPIHFLTLLVPNLFSSAGEVENFWGPPSLIWRDDTLFISANMAVLYAGSLPVLLLGLVFSRKFWCGRSIVFCLLALAAFTIYALGTQTPAFAYIQKLLPGASLFQNPVDAMLMANIMLAVATGYMLNQFFSFRGNPAFLLITGSVIILGGFWLAWMTAQDQGQMIAASPALLVSALTFAIGVFVLLLSRSVMATWPHVGAALLILFVLVDLRLHNGPNSSNAAPRDTYAFLDRYSESAAIIYLKQQLSNPQPNMLNRVEIAGLSPDWSNSAMVHGLFNTLGEEALSLSWVTEATGTLKNGMRTFTPVFPSYDSTLSTMLGLRFVVAPQNATTVQDFKPTQASPDTTLFGKMSVQRKENVFPRAWMAMNAQNVTDRAAILKNGLPALDYSTDVLLENAPAQLPRFERTGSYTLRIYRHTEIEIETQRSKGGYLVIADAWHPGWQASIDNIPVPVYRANMMMRAVIVPEGSHVVRFKFAPLCALAHKIKLERLCAF